ncbi:hypothetical protein ACH3WN_08205 [Streptomyces albogriseolus]
MRDTALGRGRGDSTPATASSARLPHPVHEKYRDSSVMRTG